MKYQKVTIKTSNESADIIYDVINQLGIKGVEINESNIRSEFIKNDDSVLIDWDEINTLSDGTEIIFYQDQDNVVIPISKLKEELIKRGVTFSINTSEVEESNWDENWKPYYHSLQLSSDIAIKPSWEDLPEEFKGLKVIQMDPRMAFGSGTHETTRLSVQALNSLNLKNKTGLDLGTGSGVLAIAAIKLGAKHVIATDIDANSIEIAKDNARENDIENIDFYVSDLLANVPDEKYDFISANLLLPIHEELIPKIGPFFKLETQMIISGIVKKQLPQIIDLIKKYDFKQVNLFEENDWLAIVISK